ncbi:MAG: protein kinase domain-containing protein [Myxococcota bacterium]
MEVVREPADSLPEQENEEDLVGRVLAGRYRIVALLGAGGMGSVYRAEHVHMRKAVAIKVLHREMTSMPEVVARFEREAVAAARIEHPNVATATDFGSLENGSFYLALEFVEGQSLAALIRADGALEEPRALRIARQIADALAAAHAAGIVHRDLKPDNVMLVDREHASDFVKVLDFGIAKVKLEHGGDQPLTQMGVVFGTPEYMSPEQARGLDVDARSDLYALGLILYEMLSGASPFRHEDLVAVLTRQITMNPEPLPENVSAGASELVMRLLRKEPADRLQTALEVREAIDALLTAPISVQLAVPPSSGTPAGTVLPAKSLVVLADGRTALALPALTHAPLRVLQAWLRRLGLERRIRVFRYAVPLGAVLGLSLLVLVAFGLSLVLLAVHPTGNGEASTLPPRPQDPDLLTLVANAEAGDLTALSALAARDAKKRSLVEWRALGHGYCKLDRAAQCLQVYTEGVTDHPEIGNDPRVLADLRKLAERLDVGEQVMVLAARSLGTAGADLLFDVWDKGKGSASGASARAKALLDEEPAKSHVSAALRALLLLQAAMKKPKCSELKQLMPDIARDVDERALLLLNRLADRRGCGFLGLSDCYACLRASGELTRALESAKTRPRPSFAPPRETNTLPPAPSAKLTPSAK